MSEITREYIAGILCAMQVAGDDEASAAIEKFIVQLETENEEWKRCADAFNEATAGVTIGKMANEHERQLLEAFRQYALLTKDAPSETPLSEVPITP